VLFFIHRISFPNAFFEKYYDVDKQLLPAAKSFANDENKNDCRAFGKPQLPSELGRSNFEVKGERLWLTNEKASFRQRARVLGREGFQTSRKDFSALHVAWGLVQRRSFIRRHHLILFFASTRATTTIFVDLIFVALGIDSFESCESR